MFFLRYHTLIKFSKKIAYSQLTYVINFIYLLQKSYLIHYEGLGNMFVCQNSC